MNLRNILLLRLIFGALCENILIKHLETLSISKAIHDVAVEFYIKNQIQFDVVTITDDARMFYQLIYHLLARNETENSHRLSSFSIDLNVAFGIEKSAIILVDSCGHLQFINFYSSFENLYTKNFKFLIFAENCGLDLLENNIDQLIKSKQITFRKGTIEHYEFLLINDRNVLYLTTIEWFTEAACNQPQLKVLNSFNKTTRKWTKKLENYEKFQNFHGCDLKMWVASELANTAFGKIDKSNDKKSKNGLIPQMYIDISRKYNFKPKFQLEREEAEVCFVIYRMEPAKDLTFHFTASFMEVRDVILATPGDLYSPYEKLWLPFDDLTWKFLFATFFVAFLIIFLINLLSKRIREIVYGVNIHNPALNVMSAFFGISQYKVPKKYFSRCLFIIFVFFCLIFRTCYQSKLFEFMTSEPRYPPPKSIHDLKDRNYIMHTHLGFKLVNKIIADDKFDW